MVVLANVLVVALGAYFALGFVFAVPFVIWGVSRIDPSAGAGSVGFRLMIFAGCVALWPVLARRWIGGKQPPDENNPHRQRARARAST